MLPLRVSCLVQFPILLCNNIFRFYILYHDPCFKNPNARPSSRHFNLERATYSNNIGKYVYLKNAIKDYVNCIQIYAFYSFCCTDPPQVTLSLGSTLRPDDIKEGDDVYFECHIKANPKEHRITWSHDVSNRNI